MTTGSAPSEFRVEKHRTDAIVTLADGQSAHGYFFVAGGSPRHAGPERVGDLLNSESGFLPFEIHERQGARTVLLNRNLIVLVAIGANEASQDPGYPVARRRVVSALMTGGTRIVGSVRVYRPEGRDRLSDWTRQPETFRYVETEAATLIVNAAHIIEVSEVPEP